MSVEMWKKEKGTYLFQTDDPVIARKLSRRKKAVLVAWGVNCYLRVYEFSNMRPDNARRMLRHIQTLKNEMVAV